MLVVLCEHNERTPLVTGWLRSRHGSTVSSPTRQLTELGYARQHGFALGRGRKAPPPAPRCLRGRARGAQLGGTLLRRGARQRAGRRQPSHRRLVWGLLRTRPGTFHLTAPSRRHRKDLVVVHFARLEPEDRTIVDGIPLTSPARTALDLARGESPPTSLASCSAPTTTNCSTAAASRRSSPAPSASWHAKLDAALRDLRPETVSSLRPRAPLPPPRPDAGLPTPADNVAVEGYEFDCYWEAEGFAVELDVYATHGSPRSFEADRERGRPPARRASS